MLLRASGRREERDYDVTAITDPAVTAGVEQEGWLGRLAEDAIRGEPRRMAATLTAAGAAMGRQQAVDALLVASAFNGITRVADATGIPLDDTTAEATVEMRAMTGLDAFSAAARSRRLH